MTGSSSTWQGRTATRGLPDPHRFDIERENAGKHLSFSGGRHFCLGAALARAEGEVGLRTFFERFPDARLAGCRQSPRHPRGMLSLRDHAWPIARGRLVSAVSRARTFLTARKIAEISSGKERSRGARGLVSVDFRAALLTRPGTSGSRPADTGADLPRLDAEQAVQTPWGREEAVRAQIIADRGPSRWIPAMSIRQTARRRSRRRDRVAQRRSPAVIDAVDHVGAGARVWTLTGPTPAAVDRRRASTSHRAPGRAPRCAGS